MVEMSRALVIDAVDEMSLKELPIPEIGDYEVLFHTQCASICTVDRRVYKGLREKKMPFLGGHEASGIIEKTGRGVVNVKPGDHAIFTSGYCMQCEECRTGHGTQCQNKGIMPKHAEFDGTIMGGGFSEYLRIPAWQIIKVDSLVPFEHACLTEPLACCVHSINKTGIHFGDTVVIIGLGIMGYFQMRLAQMRGARVIVSEPDEKRRAKAAASHAITINPRKTDAVEEVHRLTDGRGAEVVINTIPAAAIWQDAMNMLAPYGKLMCYSSQDSKKPIPVDFGKVHGKEYEFIGTLNPTLEDNNQAVKLITYGMMPMDEVIDQVFPIEQGKEAFDEALKPGAYRVVMKY
jgi:L-iditol 2-dehydrogenase